MINTINSKNEVLMGFPAKQNNYEDTLHVMELQHNASASTASDWSYSPVLSYLQLSAHNLTAFVLQKKINSSLTLPFGWELLSQCALVKGVLFYLNIMFQLLQQQYKLYWTFYCHTAFLAIKAPQCECSWKGLLSCKVRLAISISQFAIPLSIKKSF